MNNKNRLGRGLASIFNNQKDISTTKKINIDLIEKNPFQPRTNFTKIEITELANSIKTYGLIQPITVRQNTHNKFELISGERRLRAAKLIGLKEIPVFIKNIQNKNMLAVALVENIQRQNLDPMDIALSLEQLIKNYNLTHDTLGKRIGKSRSTISNYLRLLKLDPIIQAGVRDKMITMGHAKAIMNIENQTIQLEIYQTIIKDNLSVRDAEKIVKNNKLTVSKTRLTDDNLSIHYKKIENNLSDFFNEEIKLKILKNGNGKIEIPFKSEKKLDEIIQLLYSS
ncbi:MAG: ParB/RepB/Spo0J family partition protein [Flavobacteriales bacterium TMED191]|nr:MAG: ParB/RepB/Spo0J family partition protein [Flavobacteriales bacterium TMED191]|tara:strand:- start:279 stop:1127 length:849 start_codon:yes stop_codon:yes gene_type:complete